MQSHVPQLVLGVDPGLESTGYAVVTAGRALRIIETGVITTGGARVPLERRLLELRTCLARVVQQHQPAVMAMEEVFSHASYPRTAILMGHARGVIALVAGEAGMSLVGLDATRVKSVLTGNGQATKDDMRRAVRLRYAMNEAPRSEHVADALAIALCWVESAGARSAGLVAAP